MKNHKLTSWLFAMMASLIVSVCLADTDGQQSGSASKTELERILLTTQHMQGEFTQMVFSDGGNQTAPSTGQFWIEKPGKFRWNYLKPYVQQIVSDGESIWFYDPDLEQVTIKKAQTDEFVSPLSIISGNRPLDEVFMVQEKGRIDSIDWLELYPITDQSNYQSVHIGITDGKLVRMVLNDQFGQSTRLLFSAVDTQSEIDPEKFIFTAPPGVDVFKDH